MHTKIVKKHWGHEQWIADGVSTPYAFKYILFKEGNRTSLQVHRNKFETSYVLNGKGILLQSKEKFDIDNFLKKGMTDEEIDKFQSTFDKIELTPTYTFHIPPGYVHRIIAITDLEFMEVSTCHLDDVIRLQDDKGRSHGRISYEHE